MTNTVDKCDGCNVVRRSHERWFWVYADIAPEKRLEPVAVYCRPCAAERGLQRDDK